MEQFSEEYIKEVRDIIKNNDTEKAKELLKGLHPPICGTLSGFRYRWKQNSSICFSIARKQQMY